MLRYERSPLIVLSHNLAFLKNCLPGLEKIATIYVTRKEAPKAVSEAEFLQEEQLYSAQAKEEAFESYNIELHHLNGSNLLVMPNFVGAHPIASAQLSEYLLSQVLLPEHILVVSPCTLNYSTTLCKIVNIPKELALTKALEKVDYLKPPHFVSGPTAAVMSFATVQEMHAVNVVLDSEGAVNFERINEDSILEAGALISELLDLKEGKKEYIEKVKKQISANDSMGSGMYI